MPGFVIFPHAALSLKAVPRPVDAAMLEAGAALLAAAQEVQAYGLAAAHLGLNEPVVVISFAGDADPRDYRLLYNPAILQLSDETEIGPEGSVSMPGIQAPVMRALRIELAYDDAQGQRRQVEMNGFVARIAQHEVDQVNGLFFTKRLSKVKRDMATRKFLKSLDK
ncbi:peptide deformylase [Devosia sp. YR412]|uniref:peptide deformylase n=1 Tax=Devosia sp. YR412 TaxID=1881030 RepID=UPI0008B1923D|nr:peptide deformylase [Devosia sp. YR412]SEQ39409.1 peptide deformylase [Devosia sp. YR412]